MKKLFMILCVAELLVNLSVADMTGNLPNDKSENSISPQINQNFPKEIDYKKLEKNISNLPKTKQEKSELDRLFTAISNTDLNATKEILDNNPNLINLLRDSEKGKISLLGHLIMAETINETKISAILKYSQNFGLDLNQICLAKKSENEPLFYIYYPLSLILLLDNDGEKYFDLFKFFAENKSNPTNALYYSIMKTTNNNGENLREKYKKYIYEIFKNYNIDDFSNSEIILSGIDFIKLNDIEFIKLLINSGLKNNKFAYDEILKFAKENKNTNKEILNLLQGE